MAIPYDRNLVDWFLREKQVRGTHASGGFAYDLTLKVPSLVTAIHAGNRIRDELQPLICLPDDQRHFEEDTATDAIIQDCPSTIYALDSRAEYDLNRPEDVAIPLTPEQFWGIPVYQHPPTERMNRVTMAKYHAFYEFITSYIQAVIVKFGACFVYDIHSYNVTRQVEKGFDSPPLFNLGTALLDRDKWAAPIESWLDQLKRVQLPNLSTTVAENEVFKGRAEFCRRLSGWDPNILVLPTEIAKVYMDERTGVLHPPAIAALKTGIAAAIHRHITFFF
ncbi:MAG: N-formylglutamate amidohydrolase [Deltaproteobacteria bacterium]|nr:N-formylglutamate amidohydrolase [Deltaproteobacteria bacterium]